MDKHGYFTGEDLGYKPSVTEVARFEYSPLDKVSVRGKQKKIKKRALKEINRYWRQNWNADKSSQRSRKETINAIKNINICSKTLEAVT